MRASLASKALLHSARHLPLSLWLMLTMTASCCPSSSTGGSCHQSFCLNYQTMMAPVRDQREEGEMPAMSEEGSSEPYVSDSEIGEAATLLNERSSA